jgi:hypothetical protein
MKTYKNLYPRLCTFENLEQAFRKARRGKRHKPNVAAFECNLDLELITLQEELLAGAYRPGGYRHFTIYEGKPRRISAAPFRDRVVHHALCNVVNRGFRCCCATPWPETGQKQPSVHGPLAGARWRRRCGLFPATVTRRVERPNIKRPRLAG